MVKEIKWPIHSFEVTRELFDLCEYLSQQLEGEEIESIVKKLIVIKL